jgi:hypothetical protein
MSETQEFPEELKPFLRKENYSSISFRHTMNCNETKELENFLRKNFTRHGFKTYEEFWQLFMKNEKIPNVDQNGKN